MNNRYRKWGWLLVAGIVGAQVLAAPAEEPGDEPADEPAQEQAATDKGPTPEVFDPSEDISEDFAVAFPVDI